MICYTLSSCVIKGVVEEEDVRKAYAGLLMGILSDSVYSDCKLAIDKDRKAIEAYLSYDSLIISSWVKMMGLNPSKWELIDIDGLESDSAGASVEHLFKEICSNTADKIMIVYTYNGWVCKLSTVKGTILHNGIPLSVWDMDDAIEKIFKSQDRNITHNHYNNVECGVVLGEGASSKNIRIEKSH